LHLERYAPTIGSYYQDIRTPAAAIAVSWFSFHNRMSPRSAGKPGESVLQLPMFLRLPGRRTCRLAPIMREKFEAIGRDLGMHC